MHNFAKGTQARYDLDWYPPHKLIFICMMTTLYNFIVASIFHITIPSDCAKHNWLIVVCCGFAKGKVRGVHYYVYTPPQYCHWYGMYYTGVTQLTWLHRSHSINFNQPYVVCAMPLSTSRTWVPRITRGSDTAKVYMVARPTLSTAYLTLCISNHT